MTEHELEVLEAAMKVGYVLSDLLDLIEKKAALLPSDDIIDTALDVLQKHARLHTDEDSRVAEMLLFFAGGTVRGIRNLIEGIDADLIEDVENILREFNDEEA